MNIKRLCIDSLKMYENNAKIHTKSQIDQIKESIKKFGMNDPIAVWGDENIIVEGHGRYLALKELGYKEVDCIRLDHLTDEERRAYTLVHNKLTMNTDFDFGLLELELDDISFDMSEFGFFNDDQQETHENTIEQNDLKEDKVNYHTCPNCGCEFED